jgi:hypothetical protein
VDVSREVTDDNDRVFKLYNKSRSAAVSKSETVNETVSISGCPGTWLTRQTPEMEDTLRARTNPKS